MKKMLGLIALTLTLTLSTLTACTAPASTLSENDRAAIYAAAVRQLYTVDHTFGNEPPNWPVIYLLRDTDDTVGDPRVTETNSSRLQESVQEAIIAALDDLPADFIWVNNRDEVPMDRGSVEGNGAIITLGNIYLQDNSSVQVAASIYFARAGAGGATYIIEQVDRIWKVTGNTGARWIS